MSEHELDDLDRATERLVSALWATSPDDLAQMLAKLPISTLHEIAANLEEHAA